MGTEVQEKIVLTLDAAGVPDNSLSGLIGQLERVEAHVHEVHAALNGIQGGPEAARSVAELEARLKQLGTKTTALAGQSKGSVKAGAAAQLLGIDPAAFEQELARLGKSAAGYRQLVREFASAKQAAVAMHAFEVKAVEARQKAL